MVTTMVKIFSNKILQSYIGKRSFKILDMRGLRSVVGLMFNDMKKIDGALISGNSIWMPFVKRELTLIFLDSSMVVRKVKRAVPMTANIKTWKIYSCKSAKYCLEIKQKIQPKVGTKIKLKKAF